MFASTPTVDERVNEFSDGRVKQKRITGHKGGIPGINAQLDMYLDDGYTVVVLSNYDPLQGSELQPSPRTHHQQTGNASHYAETCVRYTGDKSKELNI